MKKTYILIGITLAALLISVFILKPKGNPPWVKQLIAEKEARPVENPPASIIKCEYKEQTVYFLPDRCCDIPSLLYNETGDFICSPGGGITGLGDGRCPDFYEERKDCEVIWKDLRPNP